MKTLLVAIQAAFTATPSFAHLSVYDLELFEGNLEGTIRIVLFVSNKLTNGNTVWEIKNVQQFTDQETSVKRLVDVCLEIAGEGQQPHFEESADQPGISHS